jgi:ABC-type bacteriocin/lantibiotic exporter with double-glycine peptidase domain
LFDPLNVAVDIYSRLNRLSSSIRRILELMEQAPKIANHANCIVCSLPMAGSVEMDDVSFGYGIEQTQVLAGVDLRIHPGEKIALVGVSGCGKSTIAKLIARLYDVRSGSIRIDGIDVRRIDLSNLRTAVCYVMQEAILFDRSLKENLLLGNPKATTQELVQAIEIANLSALVRRLPLGWNTPLAPRGSTLSGGERQRLALARAVLQMPSLLILDESTSAVDAPSEQRIFADLSQYFSRQTIIFISHRLSALTWVDRIIALDRGRIEEQGTHENLLRRGGLYERLYKSPLSTNILSQPSSSDVMPIQTQSPLAASD